MLWLQSSSKFDLIAEFSPDLMALYRRSKRDLGGSAPKRLDGFFYEFAGGLLVLYNQDGNIFFVSNGNRFLLDDDTIVAVAGKPTDRKLEVIHKGKTIYSTTYLTDYESKIESDPTAFVDDEDFDFGLFVSNISKDPERKSILIEN